MNDGSHAVSDDGRKNSAQKADRLSADDLGFETDLAMDEPVQAGSLQTTDSNQTPVSRRLLAARELLGLSASDVAGRTRITLRHVEALEAGDYSALPGRPYALGFARGYARAVGLDGEVIADAVRAELDGVSARPERRVLHQFEVGDPAKTPSRLLGWLALLLVTGLLAMGAVFWRSYYAPAVVLPSLAGPSDPRDPRTMPLQAGPARTVSVQRAADSTVVFTALEGGVWVKFYDGQGKQLMQKQLAKGESYAVPAEAKAPKLWTGRPDALAITVGGQAIARLADAEKIVKDVPVDAASLRSRSQSVIAAPSSAGASSQSNPQ